MSDQQASGKSEEVITLAGGCFWCVEAIFDDLKGVKQVESGYSGGHVPNPTYEQVCSGRTGHAEVIEVTFDPQVISLEDILRIFFTVHDPTTLNRQGPDVGTQYRSAIFYRNEEQKRVAQEVMQEVEASKIWDDPLVTQLEPFQAFYRAEDYHQEYYASNPNQPYCRVIIAPKVAKFREKYRSWLKR
ncbi:MAG TPA: peptide-methionine (S)-S-oxide reductase MsrA [Acidobacteriota bacterium]|nr:peptide-methionine (S)-S-oxide reductase MsrA [Acidobacteriota bacterium]